MDPHARNALSTVRRCIAAGRVVLFQHFTRRLDQRGMFWPDVLAVFDDPDSVRADGFDDWGRARWIVSGAAADESPIDVVCLIDRDAKGELTLFVTIYRMD